MVAVDLFTATALILGTMWVTLNLYTYGPLYRRALVRILGFEDARHIYDAGTKRPDSVLPTIDILLPAYDEEETIRHSIQGLRETDYPQEKLAINVLVEADDRTTRDELARLRNTHEFTELVIPPSYPGPRTKPRALNYGLANTSGDVVGIIDAEDIVDPDVFKQVVAALFDGGHHYVQGKLDMQNEDDGILNAIFRGEYGLWYRFVIPSFFRVGYPVPLGGTTNFFHREVLEQAAADRTERFGSPWTDDEQADLAAMGFSTDAAWDPWNVTEDFELGLLLWEAGYDMALMTAATREESPVGLNPWVRQRTRWQKGKLYTFYGRLRNRPTGLRRQFHVYLQSSIPHVGPVNLVGVVFLTLYANIVGLRAEPLVALVLLVGAAFILQQMVIQAYAYNAISDRPRWVRARRVVFNVLGMPFYWLLLWGSDLRAFIQLAFDHLHWEKTAHFGRHILGADGGIPEHDDAASDLSVSVFEDDEGWRWSIEEYGFPIARSSTVFDSERAAQASLVDFADTIPVAVDHREIFYIQQAADDWAWTFDTRAQRVVAPVEFATPSLAREAVGRTKVAAGVARVDRDTLPDASTVESQPVRIEEPQVPEQEALD